MLALKELLHNLKDRDWDVNPIYKIDENEGKKLIEAIEAVNKWIPVSERLPEEGEYIGDVDRYYLVQNEYGDMFVARYTHSEYWEQIYQLKPIGDEIVAWRELPQPYKQQESEGNE
jgi:hypothetical protein